MTITGRVILIAAATILSLIQVAAAQQETFEHDLFLSVSVVKDGSPVVGAFIVVTAQSDTAGGMLIPSKNGTMIPSNNETTGENGLAIFKLSPGSYAVTATYEGKEKSMTVNVGALENTQIGIDFTEAPNVGRTDTAKLSDLEIPLLFIGSVSFLWVLVVAAKRSKKRFRASNP